MQALLPVLTGLVALLLAVGLTVWFFWKRIQGSDDPVRLIVKWCATAAIFFILIKMAVDSGGGISAGALPGVAAVFGIILGIMWAPNLGALLAKPFTSFYDGGSAEVEARPFYAIARAKQKRGQYQEAIAEIRKQLQRFPEDYEGWMFLAEIHASDLKDLQGAQDCIVELLSHSHHSPKNIAFALNRAADWYLELGSDRESARQCLDRIVALYPDTELAHTAAQRIAHLTSDKMLADQKERPRLVVRHYTENLGLRGEVADPRPPAEDPATAASRLVSHLTQYPQDTEAREQLATLYATHYRRIDLAMEQVEQMIVTPGAGQKEIARWLNLLADFHVNIDQDKAAAEGALKRIIELFPGSALAAQAETRRAYLETEMLKNKTSQALKLGSYENNIGLKGQLPRNPS